MSARRGERRLFAEVDEGLAPVGELDRHEAAAAEVAGGGVDDGQRVADGDRGIDRVAAVLQHVDADLGGEMLRRDDHAVFAANGRDRRGVHRGAHNCRNRYDQAARNKMASRHGRVLLNLTVDMRWSRPKSTRLWIVPLMRIAHKLADRRIRAAVTIGKRK